MFRNFRGRVDEANQRFIRGWAARGKRPVEVTVVIRGARFNVPPTEKRPDLAPLGLPLLSGFMFLFPEPLADGDLVEVLFPNGRRVQNSPFLYSEDELAAATRGANTIKFSDKFPSHQNSIDIFRDGWASEMPIHSGLRTGGSAPFDDSRVGWAASVLGSLKNKSILELGPLEAYDSNQLERLEADVLGIEGNLSNFLKCLIVKNALSLRAMFLYGDFVQFLQRTTKRFDICWAAGVLYHARDPIAVLEGACSIAPTIFVSTHYFDQDVIFPSPAQTRFFRPNLNQRAQHDGRDIILHYRSYLQTPGRLFTGGPEEYSYWMTKDDIIGVLAGRGFEHLVMGVDDPHSSRGPACFFLASKLPLRQQT